MIFENINLILSHKVCLVGNQTAFRFKPLQRVILVDGSEVVVLQEVGYENSRLKYQALDAETGLVRTVFEGEGLMVLGDVRETVVQNHRLNRRLGQLSKVRERGQDLIVLGHMFGDLFKALREDGTETLFDISSIFYTVVEVDIRGKFPA